MTRPRAIFRLPDGSEAALGPGGLIGRSPGLPLCIEDPRISEAHAMVSLRGGDLVLLALRGDLRVGRRQVTRVPLRPGAKIELVPGIAVTVESVELPGGILALEGPDGQRHPLTATLYAITNGGELAPGYEPDAPVHLWATDDGWRWRQGDEPRTLTPGTAITVGDATWTATLVEVEGAGLHATARSESDTLPVTVVTRFETVHVHRQDGASLVLPGIPARIVSELASFSAPVPWEMVARTIWTDEPDRFVVRRNWDRHLKALRHRLLEAGFRTDLVRPDGCGNVELYLLPGDQVVDEG